jgi:hypothetical protein
MTAQLLFYEKAVPVSSGRHSGCSVEVRDYGFCGKVNSVPLMAVEFRAAAAEYPMVFVAGEEAVHPVVVLGLRAEENLFVSAAGDWQGRYLPAFVRRYPFVFSSGEDGKRFVLCVDEAFAGFNREGRGEALFTPDGQPSPFVDKVLRFLQDYRAQFMRTRAFCRKLMELALLEPMQARVSLAGAPMSLGGFSTVNRDKLKALSGDKLAELARTDELELLYLHLQSLRNFDALRARLPMLPGSVAESSDLPVTPTEAPRPAVVH